MDLYDISITVVLLSSIFNIRHFKILKVKSSPMLGKFKMRLQKTISDTIQLKKKLLMLSARFPFILIIT